MISATLKYLLNAILITCFLPLVGRSQMTPKTTSIDQMIESSHKLGLFNGNLLVIDNNKEVYRKAIGYTDASKQNKLNDNFRFHIGSIAKEFNAVAVMMLQEQGRLKITDRVSDYLIDLPSVMDEITIQDLLRYSSGLPDLQWKELSGDAMGMNAVRAIRALDFEPGTRYAYNNTNTLLQRQIVAKTSGISFATFVKKYMLKPLGMNSSLVDPDEKTPLMAVSYNNELVASPLVSPISGWTAVTMDDFLKWEKSLETFKLIGPASTRILLTPFSPGKQCGLGGGSMSGDLVQTHIHDGTALNYQALLNVDVKKGRYVILLTNNKQNSLYNINSAIQNILDGKPYIQPKKTVITPLLDALANASGETLVEKYKELKTKFRYDYDFEDETALNIVGYTLLNKKRTADAIAVLAYNTTLFPRSANAFDSLAEAYQIKGDNGNALLNYKRVLALDPKNRNAKEKINALSGKSGQKQ